MRTVISWLAFNNDFERTDVGGLEVSPAGPTAGLHARFWQHDRHVLLSQSSEDWGDPRLVALYRYLKQEHPTHPVELRYMGVRDVINVRELKEKSERLLAEYAGDEVEVFISPGTPAMQVAWYLSAVSQPQVRLFQTRRGDEQKGIPQERVDVEIERSPDGHFYVEAQVNGAAFRNEQLLESRLFGVGELARLAAGRRLAFGLEEGFAGAQEGLGLRQVPLALGQTGFEVLERPFALLQFGGKLFERPFQLHHLAGIRIQDFTPRVSGGAADRGERLLCFSGRLRNLACAPQPPTRKHQRLVGIWPRRELDHSGFRFWHPCADHTGNGSNVYFLNKRNREAKKPRRGSALSSRGGVVAITCARAFGKLR